jgi:hypothetical protein
MRIAILNVYALIFLAGLSVGCSETRTFDNPIDPNCKDDRARPSTQKINCPGNTAGVSAGSGAEGDGAESIQDSGVGAKNDTRGLHFVNAFDVSPPGCSDINGVRVLENGSDLMVFILASCGGLPTAVFAVRTSFAGEFIDSRKISLDCDDKGPVSRIAADHGGTRHFVVYACDRLGSSETYAVSVDQNGVAGQIQTVEKYPGPREIFTLDILWNEVALSFGFIHNNTFQRYSESGSKIGSPAKFGDGNYIDPPQVSTSTSTPAVRAQVFDGGWTIVARSGTGSNSGKPACAIIDTAGFLQLKQVAIGLSTDVVDYAYILSPELLIFVNRYRQSISEYQFNSSTCMPTKYPPIEISVTDSQVLGFGFRFFRALPISSREAGALYFSQENSLILAIMPRSGEFKILNELNIASFQQLHSADMKIIQNRLYVSYDQDGRGFIAQSNEIDPP